jgi:hypothetical protein
LNFLYICHQFNNFLVIDFFKNLVNYDWTRIKFPISL